MVPRDVTQAVLAGELPAIAAWAIRHSWSVDLDTNALELVAVATHPTTNQSVTFHADLVGYRAVPPAWTCRDAAGNSPKSAYPAAGQLPGVSGSVFHGNGVVCAPWNRLAYGDAGGIHQDWAAATSWLTTAAEFTQAHTLADMLNALRLHLSVSPGLQA